MCRFTMSFGQAKSSAKIVQNDGTWGTKDDLDDFFGRVGGSRPARGFPRGFTSFGHKFWESYSTRLALPSKDGDLKTNASCRGLSSKKTSTIHNF